MIGLVLLPQFWILLEIRFRIFQILLRHRDMFPNLGSPPREHGFSDLPPLSVHQVWLLKLIFPEPVMPIWVIWAFPSFTSNNKTFHILSFPSSSFGRLFQKLLQRVHILEL